MSGEHEEIKKDPRGGYRPGAGRPKGARNSRPRSPKHSDAIEASKIEKLLYGHYAGETKLSPTQLKAIEIRYSRLRPVLSAVEQTIIDPRDQADPGELAQRLAAMFEQKPELFDQVLALRAAASTQQVATQPVEQHVTH